MGLEVRHVFRICFVDRLERLGPYWYNKHMYFESRQQAGELLARELYDRYRYENCAVVALSDGGVLVGEAIAAWLHCALNLIVTQNIDVPGESLSFGAVVQNGNFTYNDQFSEGEIDEYTSEFHGYLEDQKRQAFQDINRLLGDGGTINLDLLRDRVVILVSDGLGDSMALQSAIDFLKPVRVQRLVIAAPFAAISVVDVAHVFADELHLLDVKENYLGTDHYYTQNQLPSHEEAVKRINDMIMNWR